MSTPPDDYIARELESIEIAGRIVSDLHRQTDELYAVLREHGHPVTREQLVQLIAERIPVAFGDEEGHE